MTLWLAKKYTPLEFWTQALGQSEESYENLKTPKIIPVARFLSNAMELHFSTEMMLKFIASALLPKVLSSEEVFLSKVKNLFDTGMDTDVWRDDSGFNFIIIGYEIKEGMTPKELLEFCESKKTSPEYKLLIV